MKTKSKHVGFTKLYYEIQRERKSERVVVSSVLEHVDRSEKHEVQKPK